MLVTEAYQRPALGQSAAVGPVASPAPQSRAASGAAGFGKMAPQQTLHLYIHRDDKEVPRFECDGEESNVAPKHVAPKPVQRILNFLGLLAHVLSNWGKLRMPATICASYRWDEVKRSIRIRSPCMISPEPLGNGPPIHASGPRHPALW